MLLGCGRLLGRLPGRAALNVRPSVYEMRHMSPCIFFNRGFCRFGDFCRFSHADVTACEETLPFDDRSFVHAQGREARPSQICRLRVMSYNILADHLAHEHCQELYNSSPRFALEWGYRKKLIVREIERYLPDVICLQEVDHFQELCKGLEEQGYDGMYTMRTGDRSDGLATFWRRDKFNPVKQECIRFNKLGLKDNVAQMVVLQCRQPGGSSSAGSSGSLSGQKRSWRAEERPGDAPGPGKQRQHERRRQQQQQQQQTEAKEEASLTQLPFLIVANIHVLFNPRRGDIKLAQVRTLFEHVRQLGSQHGGAPAVICGDFNSAAGSPIYQYISQGRLDLSQHERKRLSGQVEAQGKGWPALRHAFLAELQRAEQAEQARRDALECAALSSALAGFPYDPDSDPYNSLSDPPLRIHPTSIVTPEPPGTTPATPPTVPPFAPPPSPPSWDRYDSSSRGGMRSAGPGSSSSSLSSASSSGRPMRGWTGAELHLVMGGPPPDPPGKLQQQAQAHGFTPSRRRQAFQQQQQQQQPFTPPEPPAPVVACSPLAVLSAYAATTSQEPTYTTCHDKFIGTVDYIWFTPPPQQLGGGGSSEGGSGGGDPLDGRAAGDSGGGGTPGEGARYALRPLSVLQPPSLQSLKTGMPCAAWPSDHVSLIADFALYDATAQETSAGGRPML